MIANRALKVVFVGCLTYPLLMTLWAGLEMFRMGTLDGVALMVHGALLSIIVFGIRGIVLFPSNTRHKRKSVQKHNHIMDEKTAAPRLIETWTAKCLRSLNRIAPIRSG